VDDECTLIKLELGEGAGKFFEVSNSESDPEDTNPQPNGALGFGARSKTPQKSPGNLDPKKIKSKTKRDEASAMATTMREMINQMGNLSCSNQRVLERLGSLSDDQIKLKDKLSKLKFDNASSSSYCGRPSVTPTTNQEPPVVLANGARLPRKLYTQARSGEYVNLAEFSPNTEPSDIIESVMDESNQLVFRPKTVKKHIDSFLAWSTAWHGYEAILIDLDPTLYLQLAEYRMAIQRYDALYLWNSVYAYDTRHRVRLSVTGSFEFQNCNTNIFVMVLNAQSARPNTKACYYCKSLDHHVKECPFKKTESGESKSPKPRAYSSNSNANSQSAPSQSSYTGQSGKPSICFNFNEGKPCSKNCYRLHVCIGCGGPEARFRCPRCTSNQG
jgi:hypothetical protein